MDEGEYQITIVFRLHPSITIIWRFYLICLYRRHAEIFIFWNYLKYWLQMLDINIEVQYHNIIHQKKFRQNKSRKFFENRLSVSVMEICKWNNGHWEKQTSKQYTLERIQIPKLLWAVVCNSREEGQFCRLPRANLKAIFFSGT